MKNKKLCSLLLATAMLSSVTAFTSCEALDSVLKVGENVFDNAFGAVDSVLGPIVDQFENMFGDNVVETPDDSSTPDGPTTKVSVKSITLDTTEAKTEFNFAEEFTTEGVKVTATMSDGSTKAVDLKDCRIVKPDTTKPGTRTVTIVYEGQMARYEVIVKTKVIPQISATSLLDITAENESIPYRVEAENIDMVTPGVKKAEGVTDFVATAPVDADITSGDKYLTGYNVQYNYFGFTFTATKAYENTTIVLRVANSTAAAMNAGEMKMFLNFAQDENGNASGEISLDGYTIEAGAGKWTDIVLRGIDIPEGTNTLTFEVQGNKAFDLDYIDFYVGMRYINSIVEIADTTTIVKDLENFDTEKAFTRADVAAAHGLKDGQLFVESTKDSEGKTTNNGTAVGAIGKGSQMSTTLRLAQDATIRIKMKASAVGKGAYFVTDNWRFSIDGVELKMVERINIEGGDPGAGLWWDWIYTNVGEYNLPAGDHLFLVEVVSTDCNVDTFEFEVVSFGEYAENGTDLDNQHACESVCEICGKCLDEECKESACEEKCEGHTAAEASDLSIDGQVGSTATIKAPNFNWANCDVVTREDFIPSVGEGNCGKDADSIYGFTDGSVFRIKLNVEAACTLNIYLEGYGGAAFSEYSWKFGDTVITPAEGAQLADSLSKVLVGSVKVAEAGVYTFEFSFGVHSDLYNVHFEAVDPSTTPDAPSVDPEQPEVTSDLSIDGQVGSTATIKAPNFNWANCDVVTRPDFIPVVGEGNCGKSSDAIYGFDNGSVFRIKLNVEAACTLNIYLEGFGGAAFSEYSWKFGDTVITPAEGAQLAGSLSKVLVGSVKVAEAGVYTFEFSFGVESDLYNVHFEAVDPSTTPDAPSVDPEQPEVTPDITITDEATSYKVEAELLDMTTLVPQAGFEKPVVESFTGGQGLGGIGAGSYQTFTVKSDKDVNVALSISFAQSGGGSILQYIAGVSVNDQALQLIDGQIPAGIGTPQESISNFYWNVANVKIAETTLQANTVYTFKIMVNSGNLDGYVLEVVEKAPETTNIASDITLAATGVTKYELENIDCKKCAIVTRGDFIPSVGEGNCGKGSGRIYGFDNGSTFRVYVTVEAACTLKISLAGFGGNALNAYKYSFGGVELTPAEGAALGNGAVAEGVIGTVTVAEAGVYCFEFTSGINVDLDYVAFEVVEA